MTLAIDPSPWLAALNECDEEARHAAKRALGGFTEADKVLAEPLVTALASRNEEVVFWGAVALGCIRLQGVSAVPRLASLIRSHPAFGVRQAAVQAIVRVAQGQAATRNAVFSALADDNAFVRRETLQAILSLLPLAPDELARVSRLSADPNEVVSRWSEIVLRRSAKA